MLSLQAKILILNKPSSFTGLDPAEPYFEGGKEVTRLEPRDAEFVDVIHSDGSAFLNSLGMSTSITILAVPFSTL